MKIPRIKLIKTFLAACSFIVVMFISAAAYCDPPDNTLFSRNIEPGILNKGVVPKNISNTGSASYIIPIEVPPGRGGIAVPKLEITYNSNQINGWIGVGWDLDIGSIQRNTKYGLDYSDNDFVVNGSTELVLRTDWDANFYGAKIEEAFTKYQFISDESGWVATHKDGTRYYYGRDPDSRQENANGVFKWCLDKIEDTNGNTMSVEYVKDQGQIYPSRINYTDDLNFVTFNLDDDRPDIIISHKTHSEVKTAKRLANISIYGNNQLTRQYVMEYEIGTATERSRLNRINMDPLPPITFTWREGGNGTFAGAHSTGPTLGLYSGGYADINGDGFIDFIKHSLNGYFYTYLSNGDEGTFSYGGITGPTLGYNTPGYIFMGDVDGDGLPDLIKFRQSGWFYTYLSNGDEGTFSYGDTTVTTHGSNNAGEVLAGDVNGDGLTDLIKRNISGSFYTYLSNGEGLFVYEGTTLQTSGDNGPGQVIIADINGDGLVDLVKQNLAGYVFTHLSLGNGTFGDVNTNEHAAGGSSFTDTQFADINGDGLSDLIKRNINGIFRTYLSLGDGTFGSVNETITSSGVNGPGWIDFVDVNGDGLADLVKRHETNREFYTYLSLGNGFFDVNFITTPTFSGESYAGYVGFADVNGDGIEDLIKHTENGYYYTYFADGDPPDLLTGIHDSFGSTSTISYASSSNYENTLLPFIVQTVSSIEINDGLGILSTVDYTYSGGYYDAPDREFRGFQETIQTNPDGTTVERLFHQDDHKKGRMYQVDFKNPGGSMLTQETLSWSELPVNQSFFVRLDQTRTDFYNNPTVYAQKDFTYSNTHGSVVTSEASGTGAETVTTTNQYQNYGSWIWKLIQKTFEGSTTGKVRETAYDYDNGTGNLMWKEPWLLDGSHPTRVTYTYDSYGNLETVTDARGNTTTTEYETILRTHPSRVISPVTSGTSHIIEYPAYDYRWGKPTQMIDESGHITSYAYDGIGRLTQTDLPDGGQEIKSYYDSVVPRYVVTRVKEDAASDINKYEYFDGFGRLVQALTFGEAGKTIASRKYFDNMGRNYLVQGPFFASGVGYPKSPPPSYPYKQTAFDYRGRPITVVSPDEIHGTVTTILSYNGLSTTITDPDNVQKTEHKDYLNRITRITEHADAGPQNTYYDYNAAGDMLTVTNHLGDITTTGYDTLGRKRSMSDNDLGDWAYTYDANGNLDTRTDAKNQVITLAYDELNRVISKTYSTSDPLVTFTYDNPAPGANGIGLPHTISNSVTTITYGAYDEMGRELSVAKNIQGAPTSSYTTVNTYDLTGKVASTTYPDTYRVDYAYYPGTGLLHTITGPSPDSVQFALIESYQPTGKIGNISYGNGIATDYSYDSSSTRLTSIITTGAAEILNKAYNYTPAGDIASITDAQSGVTYSYAYDRLHRLILETNDGLSDNFEQATLVSTYDDNVRPLHAPASITYNGSEHFYTDDANGNLTDIPDFSDPFYNSSPRSAYNSITYNADNMPTRIENQKDDGAGVSTSTVDFVYDGNGTRAKKSLSTGDTYYIGDHFEVVNGEETKYIFAGNLRIAKITTGNSYFYHKDHLGSSSVMTDFPAGATIETTEYLPFGHERDHSGTEVTDYKFTDQEKDTETGLYNYDARMYDPVIARFISADSIIPDIYDPQSLNRYCYVRNNPLKYTDPSGHTTVGEAIDENAMRAASEGRSAALYGWSFAKAAWSGFGAENVSKVADNLATSRSDATAGDYVGAAIDVVTLGKGGGAVIAGKKLGGKLLSKASKSRVFWSGSGEARTAAESFAKAQGGKTLEMTLPGKILDKVTSKRTYPYVKPLWDKASKNFAKGAEGSVDAFQSGTKGVRLESVWRNVEHRELIKKGTKIKYHVTP